MEYERLSRDARLPYIIHVQPSRALQDDSWAWSECWHAAYQQAAWVLALAAAIQVLEGGSFNGQESEFSASFGCVRFTISQTGTTVRIRIVDFTGPNAPGPNGGLGQQPAAISRLVVGLHPSNGYFYVAVFLGVAPDTSDWTVVSKVASNNIGDKDLIGRLNETLFAIERLQGTSQLMLRRMILCYSDANSVYQKMSMENERNGAEIRPMRIFLTKLPSEPLKVQWTELFGNEAELIFGVGDLQRISEWSPGSIDLPDVRLQLRQRQPREFQDFDLN